MKRKITETLLSWKKGTGPRLPVLLYGARQVGKTYSLQAFAGDHYKSSLYINFEKMPVVAEFFNGDLSPRRLMDLLESYFTVKIIPDETLVIFDEIQACERALTSLKYFAEDAPEYHIAAAGSLLGVAINREKFSFPVGKVRLVTLYPMDFSEFLSALDKGVYAAEIKKHFEELSPMPQAMHQELMQLFRIYLYTGGMPVAVREYAEKKSFETIPEMQSNILNSYIADMAKYADAHEAVKIRGAFNSIPAQLARENKKFQYKLIRKGATAGLFGSSIEWLMMAGIVIRCEKVTEGRSPLSIFAEPSSFKLYMSDVGLYIALTRGVTVQQVLGNELPDVLKGALMENYTASSLRSNGFDLFYWESKSQAEVDFVVQMRDKAVPIEVKYDQHSRSKSLNIFMSRYKPEYAVRVSGKNFGFENGIKSVPHYAVFCIMP